ncbi:hypothetical protein A2U01_0061358, partial [Trifolium medium]|nr:hypothetical protein [Trifolium medium]
NVDGIIYHRFARSHTAETRPGTGTGTETDMGRF